MRSVTTGVSHKVSVGCDSVVCRKWIRGLQLQHYQKSPQQDVDSGVCFFCVCAHLSSTSPLSLIAGSYREGMDLLRCWCPSP